MVVDVVFKLLIFKVDVVDNEFKLLKIVVDVEFKLLIDNVESRSGGGLRQGLKRRFNLLITTASPARESNPGVRGATGRWPQPG